jgi:hypothetical protein
VFRHNTVAGDLPSLAYAMRLNVEGANLPNENVAFFHNLWSDPTGTFGATGFAGSSNDFSDTPIGETASWALERNLYFNGGAAIPTDVNELINYTDDPSGLVADPQLPSLAGLVLPRWVPGTGLFAEGSATIREAFERLVELYGKPAPGAAGIAAGEPAPGGIAAPREDILGRPRPSFAPSLGAYESAEALQVDGFESGDFSAWEVFP